MCSTHGDEAYTHMHTYAYWKGRHGRIILKWILDKYDVKPCIGLIWLQLQSHVNTVITWGFIGGESFLTGWTSINLLYSLTYCDNGGISPRIHDVGLRCTWVVIVRLRPDYPSVSVWYGLGGGAGCRKWWRRDDEEGSRDPFGKSNSGHLAGSQPLHSLSYAASYVRNLWCSGVHECSGTIIASPCRPMPVTVAFPARYSEYSGVCYNEQFLSIKSGCYSEHRCYNERGGILSADVARAYAWRIGPSRFD
jgi:hypothetical protein